MVALHVPKLFSAKQDFLLGHHRHIPPSPPRTEETDLSLAVCPDQCKSFLSENPSSLPFRSCFSDMMESFLLVHQKVRTWSPLTTPAYNPDFAFVTRTSEMYFSS